MKARLETSMVLYATAAGTQSGGSSLINKPGAIADSPAVRDEARHRLVKTNPDIDAMKLNETQQKDNAAFTGKRLIVQDTKYGHFVSEHDSSSSASLAEQARPYSRILRNPEPHNLQKSRDMSTKKLAKSNPDTGD